MTEPAHSKFAASGFEALMLCAGKLTMERGKPDNSSVYAREGTAAHQVLTWAGQQGKNAADFIGKNITVEDDVFEVDDEMAGHVQKCLDYARELAGPNGEAHYDIRVNYSQFLGVPTEDGWGTADVIVVRDNTIAVIDFKYGRGVPVFSGERLEDGIEPNPQMSCYALGAFAMFDGIVGSYDKVLMAISQPRLFDWPSVLEVSTTELTAWAAGPASDAVRKALTAESSDLLGDDWMHRYLTPGDKQCMFCKAKAECPKAREGVALAISGAITAPMTLNEFQVVKPIPVSNELTVEFLAASLDKVDLIEDWCKSIRAEVERRLLAGEPVPGYKLVQGKAGNRAWSDKAVAETTLKSMRLKVEDMYDLSLISPTSAEKLSKAKKLGPKQWTKLQELIIKPEGKKHVAPNSDPRVAIEIRPVVEDFPALPDVSDFA